MKSKNYLNHIDANLRMFMEREELTPRTSIEKENYLLSMIRNGEVEKVIKMLDNAQMSAGRMSGNLLRQMQYTAISFITLGTRVAILGGVLETNAFSMSDFFIQEIDKLDSADDVLIMIFEIAKILTIAVRESKINISYSICVKKSIDYIFKNLHYKITLQEVSENAGVTPEHLARTFKKETGKTVCKYILAERLSLSCSLLRSKKMPIKDISYALDFCSQSHYISCFKKQYHMTPSQYVKKE